MVLENLGSFLEAECALIYRHTYTPSSFTLTYKISLWMKRGMNFLKS